MAGQTIVKAAPVAFSAAAAAGQHSFTASMEMQEGQNFIISFFQVRSSHPAHAPNFNFNSYS
jgi:hypothetical protein